MSCGVFHKPSQSLEAVKPANPIHLEDHRSPYIFWQANGWGISISRNRRHKFDSKSSMSLQSNGSLVSKSDWLWINQLYKKLEFLDHKWQMSLMPEWLSGHFILILLGEEEKQLQSKSKTQDCVQWVLN